MLSQPESAARMNRRTTWGAWLLVACCLGPMTSVAAEPNPVGLQQPRSFAYPTTVQPAPRSTPPQSLPPAVVQPERLNPPAGTLLPQGARYEFAPLANVSTDIAPPAGELPTQHTLPQPASTGQPLRGEYVYSPESVAIASTSRARHFCHRPLYFEDPLLERDGCSVGVLQPVVSGARFVATIPALPYLLGSRPPRSCVCTDSAGVPHQQITPADRRRGIAAQATSAVGLVFLLP